MHAILFMSGESFVDLWYLRNVDDISPLDSDLTMAAKEKPPREQFLLTMMWNIVFDTIFLSGGHICEQGSEYFPNDSPCTDSLAVQMLKMSSQQYEVMNF